MRLVAALDGEPLVVSGREAARQHAARVVAAAGPDATYVVARGAEDVRAALLAAGAGRIVEVPAVIGCDEPAVLRARFAASDVVHAAELVAAGAPGQVWLTVAGAVAAPGARFVDASARIAEVLAAAGGVTCGPAWVALASFVHARPPLERDARVAELGGGCRAILVAPGGSTLARRARGDLRALDVASPLGVDRAWLGSFDANDAARAPLSIALVAQRLGFAPEQLSWPDLE